MRCSAAWDSPTRCGRRNRGSAGRAPATASTAHPPRCARPSHDPRFRLRPRRLSVSDIELWIKNPYGLYARHILGLEALSPLGAAPGPREKGIIIHDALSRFTRTHEKALPADIAGALMEAADDALADYAANARVRAFWRPRIARFAAWFAATEPARRKGIVQIATEVAGSRVLDAPGGPFTLRARADRIDVSPAGLVITDYKTGAPPNDKAVARRHRAAASARSGDRHRGRLCRHRRRHRDRPPLHPRDRRRTRWQGASASRPTTSTNSAQPCIADLARLVAAYDDEARAYTAIRRARFNYDYDDFAHLARVAEWSGGDDGGDDPETGGGAQ